MEIEKEIVREVARGDKPYLRKSTDRKAQIRKAFVHFSFSLSCNPGNFRKRLIFVLFVNSWNLLKLIAY